MSLCAPDSRYALVYT